MLPGIMVPLKGVCVPVSQVYFVFVFCICIKVFRPFPIGACAIIGRPSTRLFRLVSGFGARCGGHWSASSAVSRWTRAFASDAPRPEFVLRKYEGVQHTYPRVTGAPRLQSALMYTQLWTRAVGLSTQ
jgi:hypothetical protein